MFVTHAYADFFYDYNKNTTYNDEIIKYRIKKVARGRFGSKFITFKM